MSIQTLRDRLPEYAKDLKLSLGTLAGETVLDDAKKAGTFVAAAIASRNPEVIEAVVAEFGPRLDPATFAAAKAAAAISRRCSHPRLSMRRRRPLRSWR
jgi:alkyl hydroperoxide reductase subunit D